MTDPGAPVSGLSPAKRLLLQKILQEKAAAAAASEPQAIRPRAAAGPAPLSFAQQRLWFLHELEPDKPIYTVPAVHRLSGRVDEDALERALGAVVARHEALRTVFREENGEAVQVVLPSLGFSVAREDVPAFATPEEREAEAMRRAVAMAREPFDLSRGPLVRAALYRLGGEERLFALVMHHVVSDGWSMGVLFRELAALYGAYAEGREADLPPLPIQYADYAVWRREQLRGFRLAELLDHWRGRLAGAPAVLELPADRPRPPAQSYRGAKHVSHLPPSLAEAARALARAEGATPFMVLLAAFKALLGRCAVTEDVVVGSPVAGRGRPETEGLIGFFVNTLALRTDLSGDPSFRDLVARVRRTTLDAYAHQDLPFERLVEELQPERSLAYNPLVQAAFALQNAAEGGLSLPGVSARRVELDAGVSVFDLLLSADEEADGSLGCMWQYAADLFDAETVEALAARFGALLAAAVADPGLPISRLPLLVPGEREAVVHAWNRTEREYPREATLQRLFESHAAARPDAVAVTDGERELSYAELNDRANRLAHYLRRRGVGPEVRVAVCMDRSVNYVVAILGIIKAGGAYVPLDPSYPAGRLAWMMADSHPPVLLSETRVAHALPERHIETTFLDASWDAIERESGENPEPWGHADSLAYVIYTSGSTGTPKGIAIPHRGIVRLVVGTDYVDLGPDDRMAQLNNVSFDAATFELWGALLNGGALVMVSRDDSLEPAALARRLREGRVSAMVLTTALFNQVAAEEPDAFSGAKHVMIGGEALSPAAMRAVLEARPPQRLVNGYGPAESTTFAAWYVVDHVPPGAVSIPIGYPVANTTLYVLDRALSPVPVGVAGELYIGGDGLARGYLGKPGLTAERFVPDAHSGVPGSRLYATGDRARWTRDGILEYLGRADDQVKIRGFRIEPGEVEAVLAKLPGVANAAVLPREDRPGGRYLAAYVVPAEGADCTAASLRAGLRERLPDYMVPTAWAFLPALPLTPNGKVDRRALPAPDAAEVDAHEAPRTQTEELLAAIWAEVLGRERVGRGDSFFETGGHSLKATQVVSRIRSVFRVEMPVRAVFEAPTLAGLAARVDAARGGGAEHPPLARTGGDGAPRALSFAQRRLWFLDQLEPGSPLYNFPEALRLSGELDAGALRRALEEIVRRHEVLRTVFRDELGDPVQVVGEAELDFARVDLRETGDDVDAVVAAEGARPFDLALGPVFRARLYRTGDREHVLLLAMHHIASDGWSIAVLRRELGALYNAFAAGRGASLPELPLQYADFAAWQAEFLRGPVLEAELAYWRGKLEGAPPLELPLDRPRPAVQRYRGSRHRFALPPELAEELRALARREGATLFMVLLAGFKALVQRYARQDDVVVGTPIAGRTRPETEPLVGFFVNTLALRTDLSGDPSFRELIARVRETTLDAYAHQEVPWERLVEELQPERSLSRSPVFQVMLVLQNATDAPPALSGLAVEAIPSESEAAKFDLVFGLSEGGGGLQGVAAYDVDLFDRATVERMSRHFAALLAAAVADPARPVSALPISSADERRAVLSAWNDTALALPETRTVHRLFEAQAARTPSSAAIRHGGRTVSYAELNARANRLARRLRETGFGAGDVAAVLADRTPDAVAALLAAQKAGGAYLPLDPKYPAARIARVMGEAGARIALAHRRHADHLPAGTAALWLDEADPAIDALGAGDLGIEVDPAAVAYVIYTSGSTGTPKGVQVEHRNAAALLYWLRGALSDEERSSVLGATSLTFDVSIAEVFGTLCWGGSLVLVDDALSLAESGIAVRTAFLVPTAAAELLRLGALPPSLGTVFLGGEAVPLSLAAGLHAAGVKRMLNGYGPTEDTTYSTVAEVPAGVERVSIGRPIGNGRAYVLDAGLEPCPPGVPGELWMAGAGVTRGYVANPGMTAGRYLPDPFSPEPGARMYRTGDLGRWVEGELEFLGRVDTQVKVRGFRIETGEIEAALAAHPSVAEAAVAARDDRPGGWYLAAYVVPAAGAEPGAAELRAELKERLPDYMVPTAWAFLPALPLTRSGKVDRRALPSPDAPGGDGYEPPRTPTETLLASIWGEVLGRERVGRGENFFETGGHSLQATQVVSRVRSTFAVEMPVRAVFEAPTLAGLAARVDAARGGGAEQPVRVPRDGRPLPLSFAQRRLWFLDQLEPGSALYNVPEALRLSGELDVDALRRALEEIVRRHEALRTVFRADLGDPVQVVCEPELDFALVDLRETGDDVDTVVAAEGARPFDLAQGPVFRARLYRAGEREHVLLLAMHHIASDGWSIAVLRRELEALYNAFAAGRGASLPELPLQYADFAAWQAELLRGPVLEAELAYWRGKLEGAPALELPLDRPRPPAQRHRGGKLRFVLAPEVADGLRALSRREGATLFMVLLAGFKALMQRYARQDDVVVGTPIAGRTRPETEPLVGFFVNTLALRTDLSGDPSFRELIARVRETTLDAYAHQEVPWERLVEELQPERSLARSPVFQVMLVLQNNPDAAPALSGLAVETIPSENDAAKFDLSFGLSEGRDGLRGVASYDCDLFDHATVERMARHFTALLAAAVAEPSRPVSTLAIASADERRTVLAAWNDTAMPLPETRTVHRLFEAQAARTPGATAIRHAGRTVTYAELNARANRLARRLREMGFGMGDVAAVVADRTPDAVAALLAAQKAGGAYLPLDPAYPAARIARVMEEAGARAALAHRHHADRVPSAVATLWLDEADASVDRFDGSDLGIDADPASVAYVIYTSGSTGTPKGVQVEHRNATAFLHWLRSVVADGERTAVLGATSLTFDVSIAEVFGTLCWGGALVLVDDALSLAGLGEPVRTACLVPTAAAELLRLGALPPSLETVILGGEAVPPTLAAGLHAAGVKRVLNGYGPTEDTTYSTVAEIAADVERVSIGRPIGNGRAYVLDAGLEPCPPGVPGELWMAGAGVTRGYVANPGMTAGRYLPDPFSPEPSARMYRTGDLGRWVDGELEFLGRVDTQVKVRGFRIETAEIEAALAAHPAVAEAAVALRDAHGAGPALVGYYAAPERDDPGAGALREHLKQILPDYMIPAAFVRLQSLPRTTSGKVDRRALPDPERSGGDAVPPRTATESAVLEIWRDVLGGGAFGVRDNFFDLGGHSLLATRVVARVHGAFGVQLPLRALFESPTVELLARDVDSALSRGLSGLSAGAGDIVPVARERRGRRPSPA